MARNTELTALSLGERVADVGGRVRGQFKVSSPLPEGDAWGSGKETFYGQRKTIWPS
jgi:hypothetical protein